MKSWKSAFLGSIAVVGLMLTITPLPGAEAPESKPESKGKSVAELQQERLAVLQQLVEVAYADYRVGKVDIEQGMRAQQQLLNAKLELAKGRESRLKILSESVKLATEWEKVAQARFHAGQASQADALQCRAQRLKAEIALHREREAQK